MKTTSFLIAGMGTLTTASLCVAEEVLGQQEPTMIIFLCGLAAVQILNVRMLYAFFELQKATEAETALAAMKIGEML